MIRLNTFLCRFLQLSTFLFETAVAPAPKEHKGTNWYITTVATVLILLFVVALCVYAPCGCLWKRHRGEYDVTCPITASQRGKCSVCYLHSIAATNKMTSEKKTQHVGIAMATNGNYHRPSLGNSSKQVKIITDDNSNFILELLLCVNLLEIQDNIVIIFLLTSCQVS